MNARSALLAISYLHVERSLGLQAGVVVVEAQVAAFGRASIAGVIVERRHFLLQLLSRITFRENLVRQLHLLLHELFHFGCIRILQPEKKIAFACIKRPYTKLLQRSPALSLKHRMRRFQRIENLNSNTTGWEKNGGVE